MAAFPLFFALGVWLLQQQAALPALAWTWLPGLYLLALLVPRKRLWQRLLRHALLAAFACSTGFMHAAWLAHERQSSKLPAEWQGRDIEVVGVVAELPRQRERGLGFSFDVEQTLTPGVYVPRHILLSTYASEDEEPIMPHAGERWRLTVRLKQPHGTSNPYGFDFEAWMLERDLRASGYVRSKEKHERLDELVARPAYVIEHLRERVRERFQATLGGKPYAGVLVALAIGDQASIPATQWQIFTRTGVNHLMSISGLHITMLSGLAFALAYAAWRRSGRLPLHLPARKAGAVAGLSTAFTYSLLSGFSVPAQRTVYMLAAVAAALLLSRNLAASQILAAALLTVLLLDPWAVLSPGFWLSFGAVGLILYVTANRLERNRPLIEYGRVQWAMLVGLLPPLLALFQQVSLVSPLANACAIPLVEFVVVPLVLLGALLPIDWPLHLAHAVMGWCYPALEWLSELPDAVWAQHAPPMWSVVAGMAGALWCLLPRGFPARWLGLFMLLPMFLLAPEPPSPYSLRMVIFDVGQGLSVLMQTRNHTLLYDAGPDFPGEADSGNRILLPSLRGLGIAQLDVLMLTHDDSDHTGGALSLMRSMPITLLSSSLPDDSAIVQQSHMAQRCMEGQGWDWDGVHFEILHPGRHAYGGKTSKNNLGCTLRISIGQLSVLLAADIEKDAEQRLLQRHPDRLPSTLLVVPHHGSKTSSTAEFVVAVHPRYAVFTAGYRNRFGHPRGEVLERYRAIGSELLRSDEDGAILIDIDGNNFSVERFRKSHARYWMHASASG